MTRRDALVVLALILANVLLQTWNGERAFLGSDEGVYLYTAKLLGEGVVPYRDLFVAHPPLLLYVSAGLFAIARENLAALRVLIALSVFGTLFPVYAVVLGATRSRLAAVLAAILFSTFAVLVEQDAYSLALRPLSLPFLAFAIYFIAVKPRPKTAGALLGLFAASLISNALVAGALVLALVAGAWRAGEPPLVWARRNAGFLAAFAAVCLLGYGPAFAIPRGFENMIGYQVGRPRLPLAGRASECWRVLPVNWPMFLFGGLGSLFAHEKLGLFGLFNALALAVALFAGVYFYPHYLSILAVGLAVSAGIFFGKLAAGRAARAAVAALVLASVCVAAFAHLRMYWITKRDPFFFKTVSALEKCAEPVFASEPIYALYAKKRLTFHYHAADMRYYRVLGAKLDERTCLEILKGSRTVLIESYLQWAVPRSCGEYVEKNFRLVYQDRYGIVVTR